LGQGRNLETDHRRRYLERIAKLMRRPTPPSTELLVLDNSRRRCALCYKLKGDLTEKRGQIAHLDQNPANYAEGNLACLCLEHHSEYDSRTSQHKNYTIAEVKKARDDLHAAIQASRHLAAPAVRTEGRNADRNSLKDIIQMLSKTIGRLRNWSFNGTSFPVAWFDPITEFLNERRGPEFEFVDSELETYRKAMIDKLGRLGRLIDTVTRPVPGQSGWYRIPIEWLDTKPTHYNKMAERFDTSTRRVCANYDTLIRAARRKLEA
jgi:hypothetical protein